MNVLKIEKCAVNAGEGFRTVVWCAGCENKCPGCHNPESWDEHNGMVFNYSLMNKTIEYIKSNNFISGLSLSGGDPLFPKNRKNVCDFLQIYKDQCDKSVWCWTGYLWEDVKDLELMQYIDILIDGPYIDELRDITLHWKGSKNQRVIDVQKSIKENKVILYGE